MPATEAKYDFLSAEFLEAMNDIGRHGFEKYGDVIKNYEGRKPGERWTPTQVAAHAGKHFGAYLAGIPHDHFGTRAHQLAAVAYNAMMEFMFSGSTHEE